MSIKWSKIGLNYHFQGGVKPNFCLCFGVVHVLIPKFRGGEVLIVAVRLRGDTSAFKNFEDLMKLKKL